MKGPPPMWLLRLLVTAALIMFVFPHYGLMGFEGGVFGGLWAALVVGVVGTVLGVVLLPLLVAALVGAGITGGLLAGPIGARIFLFGVYAGSYWLTLTVAAGMLSGVTLVSAGATFGAAAIL